MLKIILCRYPVSNLGLELTAADMDNAYVQLAASEDAIVHHPVFMDISDADFSEGQPYNIELIVVELGEARTVMNDKRKSAFSLRSLEFAPYISC